MEWYWQWKTQVPSEKPVQVPLCPPHISHGLDWTGTESGTPWWEASDQRLQPWYSPTSFSSSYLAILVTLKLKAITIWLSGVTSALDTFMYSYRARGEYIRQTMDRLMCHHPHQPWDFLQWPQYRTELSISSASNLSYLYKILFATELRYNNILSIIDTCQRDVKFAINPYMGIIRKNLQTKRLNQIPWTVKITYAHIHMHTHTHTQNNSIFWPN